MTDRSKIVDFYLERIKDKEFEISQVRSDLEKSNFEEAEIKVIVRLVDKELQRYLLVKTSNKKVTI